MTYEEYMEQHGNDHEEREERSPCSSGPDAELLGDNEDHCRHMMPVGEWCEDCRDYVELGDEDD